jgi:hypothetical protein
VVAVAGFGNTGVALAAAKILNEVTHVPSAVAAARTYDALRLVTLAMDQANSTEGDKIQQPWKSSLNVPPRL